MSAYRSTAIVSFLAALVAAVVAKHSLTRATVAVARATAAGIRIYPDRDMVLGASFGLANVALIILGLLCWLFASLHKERGSWGVVRVLLIVNLLFWAIFA